MVAQIIKPPPFDQLAHIPEPVLELLRRMLAKSPDDRFQTPQEVQDAVERISEGLVSACFLPRHQGRLPPNEGS
jgi:hypothetical protein